MSILYIDLLAATRTKDLDGRLDHVRSSARIFLSIVLDRFFDQRGHIRLSVLSKTNKLAVVVSFRMLDLDFRIRRHHFYAIIALLHVGRKISQSELTTEQ